MYLARTRVLFFLAFIACALSLATAVYLQSAYALNPCLMCRWQRMLLAIGAIICLVAALHGPGITGWNGYAVLVLIVALSGASLAGAQIWLQTSTQEQWLPVLMALEHTLDALSLQTWGDRLQEESLLCAEINWSLCGISLPEWSLLAFVGLGLLALYPLLSRRRGGSRCSGRPDDQTLV